ncbi:pyridoxal-phosphate dependent enzyme [Tenacibaculum finnmarkense]|nr:pyridoxal-phosphate dependent enzyme [Tenacibaculum finnmarkense]
MQTQTIYSPTIKAVREAVATLKGVAIETPLLNNYIYSEKYNANIFLKREDLQQVRSYKIRGAYNKMNSVTQAQRANGIVCASARKPCARSCFCV